MPPSAPASTAHAQDPDDPLQASPELSLVTDEEVAAEVAPGVFVVRARRTQAERRAATRGALLEATLSSLHEVGYARLTTSDVAARAGVTRGAQAHYFATKAELVVAAMQHLVEKLLAELAAKPMRTPDGARAQYELLLNRMWEIHAGPPAAALLELYVAARTDVDLQAHLLRSERVIQRRLQETSAAVVPELTMQPGFAAGTITALATIRGLWLLRATVSDSTVRRLWNASKEQLVAGFAEESGVE